jgi:hypothetical protein
MGKLHAPSLLIESLRMAEWSVRLQMATRNRRPAVPPASVVGARIPCVLAGVNHGPLGLLSMPLMEVRNVANKTALRKAGRAVLTASVRGHRGACALPLHIRENTFIRFWFQVAAWSAQLYMGKRKRNPAGRIALGRGPSGESVPGCFTVVPICTVWSWRMGA